MSKNARGEWRAESELWLCPPLSRLGHSSKLDSSLCSIGSGYSEPKPFFGRKATGRRAKPGNGPKSEREPHKGSDSL